MATAEFDSAIVTPRRRAGLRERLTRGTWLPGLLAQIGARRAKKPFKLGKIVVAARHDQVRELLCRDLDFGIAEVNAVKIGEVNDGPFVLGMDRSAVLEAERRALYASLGSVDLGALREAASREIAEALGAVPAGGSIDVVGAYARPIAARTAQRLFGISPPERMFMEAVRSVFAHTFLNQANDKKVRERAIRAGGYMAGWFRDEIARRRASDDLGDDMMGQLLRQGVLDDDGVRRTLGGMLVGSIDTTATCVAKIVKVASRDSALRWAMEKDSGDLDRMDGWCNEALRRWPHNPIVIRHALNDADLAGCKVKKGDTLFAWTQAAMQDESAFPDAKRMDPERDRSAYLHMGWGLHPCSGRPVNRFQIPMLVAGLAARGLGRVGPIQWTGPFPGRLDATLRKEPN
jgi:cytochrome P450